MRFTLREICAYIVDLTFYLLKGKKDNFYLLKGKKKKRKEDEINKGTVRAMKNARTTDNQTAFTGTSCLFTEYQTAENGIAPSLEKAYAILQLIDKTSYFKNLSNQNAGASCILIKCNDLTR